MTQETHHGRCRCGAVSFAATGEPLRVANCHCRDCRKATGAAFATFVDYIKERVDFTGEPTSHHSSPHAERLFCGTCGAPIGYRGEDSPEINLHLGAFDHPEKFEPTEDCHQESALWKK